MIVVEGPDGAGKTTLIGELLQRFPEYEVAARVVSKDTEAMVDLRRWVEDDNLAPGKGILYDRHRLISEPIYGPLMRPHSPEPGFDNLSWFYEELAQFYAKRPMIIYCVPPLRTVRANVIDDADNIAVADKITAIWQGYMNKAATDMSAGRGLIYDYTTDSLPRLLANVSDKVRRERHFW